MLILSSLLIFLPFGLLLVKCIFKMIPLDFCWIIWPPLSVQPSLHLKIYCSCLPYQGRTLIKIQTGGGGGGGGGQYFFYKHICHYFLQQQNFIFFKYENLGGGAGGGVNCHPPPPPPRKVRPCISMCVCIIAVGEKSCCPCLQTFMYIFFFHHDHDHHHHHHHHHYYYISQEH